MKIKIIASNPIDDKTCGIEHHVGQVFDAYFINDNVVIRNPIGADMVVYAGEYEILEV